MTDVQRSAESPDFWTEDGEHFHADSFGWRVTCEEADCDEPQD